METSVTRIKYTMHNVED